MKATLVTGPGEIIVTTVEDPIPGPGQVIVDVDLCGVCGTDLHVVNGEHAAVQFPVIPGHEFIGRVTAHGPAVTYPPIGSTVAVDPMVYCGYCVPCRDGQTNLCDNGGGLGTTSPGAFAERCAVAAAQCQVLPESMPAQWGAMIEPLACAVHALDRLGPVLGQDVLVFGAGPVGLFLVRLLQLAGARVDLVERNAQRLSLGKEFGATRTARDAGDLEQPDLWHVVVDATGNPNAIGAALKLVRKAGRFGIFGVADSEAAVPLSPYQVFARELTIIGSNSVRASFGRAAALMASGSFNVDLLMSPPSALDDVTAAFDRTRAGEGFKSAVSPSGRFL